MLKYPAPLGYFFTYYNTRITEERKAQIERVNEQVMDHAHPHACFALGIVFSLSHCHPLCYVHAVTIALPIASIS